ncbi:PAS domain S-box-containing protein/diguanylate cyclase (GGDEF) domain-containing protein [Geodermatophilus siccatus]|uniref:PAS domain S-box-containing protein/diguanylate cyclase (GGDEF) domain-containing protein n=1 Tax=Geodermatophilus siccatus TaxID=1137991 RepID=A0A1G9QL45_9ACTN|nr:EAL domain-containing protein [Geodermatophilus siccatus]SDM11237.1 PAS domain S-box-containing protein/diguanylate cyclase (GGDEF) domain-containing protein [Geodermatophilus siccatus]
MHDAADGEDDWQISWDAPLRTARAQAAALTSTTDAVCRVDREWRFTLVNAAAERLLGHPASDLVGRSVWDVFPDWVDRDLYEALHEAVEHRAPVSLFTLEARWRRWFEVRAFTDATGLSVFFRDADDLRRMAQEQAARTELLRAALEVSPAATVLLDADGTILATNRQWFAFGERKGEARELRAPGTSYHDAALRHVTPFDARTIHRGLEALAAGTEDAFAHDCAVPVEGSLVWFHVQASRVDDAGRMVVTHTDITHRVQAEEAALWRARHDHLTDLPNRAYLHELIARALRRPGRGPVTVLFMDLDGFKAVNDSLGHEAGDELLRHVAARLSARTRGDDVVGRLGGDEFVVLAHDCDPAGGVALAERMQTAFDSPFVLGDAQLSLTASIGITTSDTEHQTPEQLIRAADTAMYAAKTGGRDRSHVPVRGLPQSARHRPRAGAGLDRAIAEDQLRLHYQPFLDLRSGAVAGCEALLRWDHPEQGMLAPEDFLPLAEEAGLLGPLTRWALTTATTAAARWAAAGRPALVTVDIHPRLSCAVSLADDVTAALTASGLPASRLGLELAESALAEDPGRIADQLHQLHAQGVGLFMDNFGTGGAPLGRLLTLPITTLKLDPGLLADEPEPAIGARRGALAALVALATAMGADALAQGIRTPQQLARARAAGCRHGQGHLLSAPMPADHVVDWLAAHGVGDQPPPARGE